MFHLRDGLWVEAQKEGYMETLPELHEIYATFYVTEHVNFREIRDGIAQFQTMQKIIFTTMLNKHALASLFAHLSMRGETAETFKEALDFLQKFDSELPNHD